jgi:hypothetical protein
VSEHGKVTSYTYGGCRCDLCRAANTEARRRWRANRRTQEMPAALHGTQGGYTNWACRCEQCTEAMRLYWREYRARVW